MNYSSLGFALFLGITVLLYYVIPAKLQWKLLLLASAFFYIQAGLSLSGYLVATLLTTWGAAWLIYTRLQKGKKTTWILLLAAFFNIGLMAVLKAGLVLGQSVLLPLGMSFYTFQTLGYLIDVHRSTVKPEKNFFRYALFAGYFPQILSGPIGRFEMLSKQFFLPKRFDYEGFCFGLQRMAWGFFKKMVIADRAAIYVNEVFDHAVYYRGFPIVFAALLFALQLYTDFSGCMDIAIGASELFGIRLSENFQTPFLSRSVSEFWRRWHITLGEWFKDYVFYPLLKSSPLLALQKKCKKFLPKKKAQNATTYLAMLVLWFSIGIWHGLELHYIWGAGLIFYTYIVGGKLLAPLFSWIIWVFKVNKECFSYRLFERIRTFLLVDFAWIFWRADSMDTAFIILNNMVAEWNPWYLFDQTSLYEIALGRTEWMILLCSVLVLFIVSLQKQKSSIRGMLASQNIVFRYTVWIALITVIFIFGQYGPSYDSQSFIYFQF